MKDFNLRRCKVTYMEGDYFYFHKWVEIADIQLHPEDPQKDCAYARTFALLENIKTGGICFTSPKCIVFENK